MAIAPDAALTVFSFREEPWEPRFLDDIRELAESRHHRFFETRRVGAAAHELHWSTDAPDLLLAVSWRYLVPERTFKRARRGAFVFHDSLLPRYRGFSPTVWAIANGERETGVTLFEMQQRVDAGAIVAQRSVPIGATDTIATVMERVTETYLSVLDDTLPALLGGTAPRTPQDESLGTYCCKRTPEDNRIDWTAPARNICDLVRAVTTPYPGAFTTLDGRRVRIWSASPAPAAPRYVGAVAGRVVESNLERGVLVLAGQGSVLLHEVQLDEGEVLNAAQLCTRLDQTFR